MKYQGRQADVANVTAETPKSEDFSHALVMNNHATDEERLLSLHLGAHAV